MVAPHIPRFRRQSVLRLAVPGRGRNQTEVQNGRSVSAWAGVVLHPVTASTRAGVAMPRMRGQTRRERANLVDLLVAGRDDARTVVQNRPGLYPHPPSPDGRHDTKPNPPSRSSDSVEGRRCCPPAHQHLACPAPPPLPPHSSFLFLPPDRRLLDFSCSPQSSRREDR